MSRARAFDEAVYELIGLCHGEEQTRHGAIVTYAFDTLAEADTAKRIIDGLLDGPWTGDVFGLGRLTVCNPHGAVVNVGDRVLVRGVEAVNPETWYVRALWSGWARIATLAGDERKVDVEDLIVVADTDLEPF